PLDPYRRWLAMQRNYRPVLLVFSVGLMLLVLPGAMVLFGPTATAYFPGDAAGGAAGAHLPAGGATALEAFGCSHATEWHRAHGIDRQVNLRAARLLAQCGQGGMVLSARSTPVANGDLPSLARAILPLDLGGMDSDVVLPDGNYPKVTQSEDMIWANGQTIVVN